MGLLAEKNPPEVLLDCQGVGYEVLVPMSTFYNLPAAGERVTLLTHVERNLTGSRAGSHRPQKDIPLIVDMYRRGIIKLDELVSARYPLTEWRRAADDLHDGKLARGVLQISEP